MCNGWLLVFLYISQSSKFIGRLTPPERQAGSGWEWFHLTGLNVWLTVGGVWLYISQEYAQTEAIKVSEIITKSISK